MQRTKAPVFRADDGKWRAVAKFSEDNYLMCRDEEGSVSYAPLCIQSFELSAPRMDTQDVLPFSASMYLTFWMTITVSNTMGRGEP